MTMENWNEVLYLAMHSEINNAIVSLYMIFWIFVSNYVLLNLFLAILIDGFTSKTEHDEDDIYFGEEDEE